MLLLCHFLVSCATPRAHVCPNTYTGSWMCHVMPAWPFIFAQTSVEKKSAETSVSSPPADLQSNSVHALLCCVLYQHHACTSSRSSDAYMVSTASSQCSSPTTSVRSVSVAIYNVMGSTSSCVPAVSCATSLLMPSCIWSMETKSWLTLPTSTVRLCVRYPLLAHQVLQPIHDSSYLLQSWAASGREPLSILPSGKALFPFFWPSELSCLAESV